MSVEEDILAQLAEDYPPAATAWVRDAGWSGPEPVPLDRIDFSNSDQWRAMAEPGKVDKFAKKIGKGKMKPIIAVQAPGADKLTVIDGHHRALAYQQLGRPALAYVGKVSSATGPWLEMHSSQIGGPSAMSDDNDGEAQALDLGTADVHKPAAVTTAISAAKRKALPTGQFADPENRAYPIDTAARTRNAAARLEQQKANMPAEKYKAIRGKIAAAAKKFGIDSQYNAPRGKGKSKGAKLRMAFTHPDGSRLEVRHMSQGEGDCVLMLPAQPICVD